MKLPRLNNTVITGLSKYIKLFALELTDWDRRDFNKPRTYLQDMGDKFIVTKARTSAARIRATIACIHKLTSFF